MKRNRTIGIIAVVGAISFAGLALVRVQASERIRMVQVDDANLPKKASVTNAPVAGPLVNFALFITNQTNQNATAIFTNIVGNVTNFLIVNSPNLAGVTNFPQTNVIALITSTNQANAALTNAANYNQLIQKY